MAEPHPRFRQEPDRSANARLAMVLLLIMMVFAIGTVWAYGILTRRERVLRPDGPGPLPPEANGAEVGIVIHRMFDPARAWPELAKHQEERLASYGWVDRERGRIHIPIDRAIELVAAEKGAR